MFIRDVIRDREPYSLKASATVLDAAEFMAQRRIGAVCVLDENGKLIGVFSERDLLNREVVLRNDPQTMKLGDVTSPLRAVIRCDETPHQALERMERIGSRHLPVVCIYHSISSRGVSTKAAPPAVQWSWRLVTPQAAGQSS